MMHLSQHLHGKFEEKKLFAYLDEYQLNAGTAYVWL